MRRVRRVQHSICVGVDRRHRPTHSCETVGSAEPARSSVGLVLGNRWVRAFKGVVCFQWTAPDLLDQYTGDLEPGRRGAVKTGAIITAVLLFVVAGGCAETHGPPLTDAPLRSTLLFDARPGWPMAADMAFRSTWPATPSYAALGEDIFYREHFVDVQYGGGGYGRLRDHVYRRFDTYRVGRARR